MLIGELSDKTGLSRDTIRFYEKQGLIEIRRNQRRLNNYKEYSEEILERLLLIKRIKEFGFTLNEIAEFLEMIETRTNSCGNVSQKALEKVGLIEQKIKELENIKSLILFGIDKCQTYCEANNETDNCQILSLNFPADF